jgi:hypothetical protein
MDRIKFGEIRPHGTKDLRRVIRTFDDATVRSHKAPSDEADRSSLGRSLVA